MDSVVASCLSLLSELLCVAMIMTVELKQQQVLYFLALVCAFFLQLSGSPGPEPVTEYMKL